MSHSGLSEQEPSEQYESSHRSVPTLSRIRPALVLGGEELVKTALSVRMPVLGDAAPMAVDEELRRAGRSIQQGKTGTSWGRCVDGKRAR